MIIPAAKKNIYLKMIALLQQQKLLNNLEKTYKILVEKFIKAY